MTFNHKMLEFSYQNLHLQFSPALLKYELSIPYGSGTLTQR